jgi:hypothetical protein
VSGAVNDRHAFHRDVEALLGFTQTTVSDAHTKILNLLNRAYAHGYRDADPDNRQHYAIPDGSEVILDGAGRILSHIPPRTVVEGTVSGKLRTFIQGEHLHVWDEERSETVAMFEVPPNVAFNVHRVTGEFGGESQDEQQMRQVAEEVRVRWAASRALPAPHYIVCLPHDFVAKIKARVEDLADDHGVATGISNAVDMFVDQLDAWTEWDALKGWR